MEKERERERKKEEYRNINRKSDVCVRERQYFNERKLKQ